MELLTEQYSSKTNDQFRGTLHPKVSTDSIIFSGGK